MLTIVTPEFEVYDNVKEEFIKMKSYKLNLEHSLISISKWESLTGKRFLSEEYEKTNEDIKLYIKCMTLNSVDDIAYHCLSSDNYDAIREYIHNPMTATTFTDIGGAGGGCSRSNNMSSELIYYHMISFNIPMECEKWHLNRLLTLIRVCDVKNSPSKKKDMKEVYKDYRSINEARRKKMGTKG